MRLILGTLFLFFSLSLFSQDPFILPEKAENFYNQYYSSVHEKYRKTIEEIVFTTRGKDIAADSLHQSFQQKFPVLSGQDIDALVIFVMMQSAKNDIQDMKAILAAMKAASSKKKPTPTRTKKNTSDSITDEERKSNDKQREQTSSADASPAALYQARLQQTTDRRLISNEIMNRLMGKINDKQEAIIKVLKQ